MKKKLSKWKGLNGLTAHGRTIFSGQLPYIFTAQILGSTHGYSGENHEMDRQGQGPPSTPMEQRNTILEEGERGTEKVNKRFMRQGTEYNSKQDLGLGLLH